MSYRRAVAWIALNDEDWNTDDLEFAASMVTVQLVADLMDKEPEEVAAAVLRYRKKHGGSA